MQGGGRKINFKISQYTLPLQRSRRTDASHPVEQPSQGRISAEWGSPPGPSLEATAWKKAKPEQETFSVQLCFQINFMTKGKKTLPEKQSPFP